MRAPYEEPPHDHDSRSRSQLRHLAAHRRPTRRTQLTKTQHAQPPVPWRHNVEGADTMKKVGRYMVALIVCRLFVQFYLESANRWQPPAPARG